VKLTGKLTVDQRKDVILKMLEILTCAGGTNKIIEYFGPGAKASASLAAARSPTWARIGATTPSSPATRHVSYLRRLPQGHRCEAAKISGALNADASAHIRRRNTTISHRDQPRQTRTMLVGPIRPTSHTRPAR